MNDGHFRIWGSCLTLVVAVAAVNASTAVASTTPALPIAGTTCASDACTARSFVPRRATSFAISVGTKCPPMLPSPPLKRSIAPINIGNVVGASPLPIGPSSLTTSPVEVSSYASKRGTEVIVTYSQCTLVKGRVSIATQVLHVPVAAGAKLTVDTYRGTLPQR